MKAANIPGFVKKNKLYFLFAFGLFAALLLSINFHTDGSSVTPGNYFIYRVSYFSDFLRLEVNAVNQAVITDGDSDQLASQEYFTLVFLGDKTYFIEDGLGNRLIPQSEGLFMVEPPFEDIEGQKWQIRRWKNSRYFTITNVQSNLSIYAEGACPLQYGDDTEDMKKYLFEFAPAP